MIFGLLRVTASNDLETIFKRQSQQELVVSEACGGFYHARRGFRYKYSVATSKYLKTENTIKTSHLELDQTYLVDPNHTDKYSRSAEDGLIKRPSTQDTANSVW